MDKEMSISDTIDLLFSDNPDAKSTLQDVSDLIKQKHGQDLWFCELMGRRWAFRAGSPKTLTGTYRYLLNEDWGIIADNICISLNEWKLICSCLKRNLEKNKN
jgi:hypothetical protein